MNSHRGDVQDIYEREAGEGLSPRNLEIAYSR
jgi:hypothetical protein